MGLTVVNGGGGPAPLPVRGAETRANPAEAVPGIRPDDRQAVAENMATPPTPRNGAVRGSISRPQLPRRRAQEHIVPELRGGPAPRQESEFLVGHDPGLMAAFQRGIGLAEAQCRDEEPVGPAHMEPTHMESTHVEPPHAEPAHKGPAHMGSDHMGLAHMDGTSFGDASPAYPAHGQPEHSEPSEASDPRESAPAPGHDLTARHDGSTPAG